MLKAILFDFHGVLCSDHFYGKFLKDAHPTVYDWIQQNVFENKEVLHSWMRGRRTLHSIHSLISRETGINQDELLYFFIKSVLAMRLDLRVITLLQKLKQNGIKTALVTDNMKIFQIIVLRYRLKDFFDTIVNSSHHGLLKNDKRGRLFDITLAELKVGINDSLVIDDSESVITLYKEKGGNGFLYKEFKDLEKFLEVA